MKKIIFTLTALATLLLFSSCGGGGGSSYDPEEKSSMEGGDLKGRTWLYESSYSGTDKPAQSSSSDSDNNSGSDDDEEDDNGKGGSGDSSEDNSNESNAGSSGSASAKVTKLYVHFDAEKDIAWFGTVEWTESAGDIDQSSIKITPKYRGPYTADEEAENISFAFDMKKVEIKDSTTSSSTNNSSNSNNSGYPYALSARNYWRAADYENGNFEKGLEDGTYGYDPYGKNQNGFDPYGENGYNSENGFGYGDGTDGTESGDGTEGTGNGSGTAAQTSSDEFWARTASTKADIRKSLNGGDESYGLFDKDYKTSKQWDKFYYDASKARLILQADYKDAGYDAWSKWVWEEPPVDLDIKKLEGPSVETKDTFKSKVYVKAPDANAKETNYSYIVFSDKYEDNAGYFGLGTDGIKLGESAGSYKGSYRGSAKASAMYVISNGYVVVDAKSKYKIDSTNNKLIDGDKEYKLEADAKIYGSNAKYPSVTNADVRSKSDFQKDKDWCFQEATFSNENGIELRFIKDKDGDYYRFIDGYTSAGQACTRFLPDGFYKGSEFVAITFDADKQQISYNNGIKDIELKFANRPTYDRNAAKAEDLTIESFIIPHSWTRSVKDGYSTIKYYFNQEFNYSTKKATKDVPNNINAVIDNSAKTITINATQDLPDTVHVVYQLGTDGSELYIGDRAIPNHYNEFTTKYDYSVWYIGHDSDGNLYWFNECDEYKGQVNCSATWSRIETLMSQSYTIYDDKTLKNQIGIKLPNGEYMTYTAFKSYYAKALLVDKPAEATQSTGNTGYDGYKEIYAAPRYAFGATYDQTKDESTYNNGIELKDGTILTVKKGDLKKDYTVKVIVTPAEENSTN